MKALRVCTCLLIACSGVPGFASGPGADADPLSGVTGLLAQEHQHSRPSTPPLSLAELETAALANNSEIRVAMRRVAIAETRVRSAGSLSDPEFMFNQSLPGPGKRALRTQLASEGVEQVKAELEAKKRDVTAQVRKTFYDLLRNQDELLLHDEQAALARQSSESARIKYVVGRVPQQDVLKAQIALTKLVEHLVMLEQDGGLARARLNTLLGRDPGSPLEVQGQYSPPQKIPALLDLEKDALENRPELAMSSSGVRQGKARTKLAEKAYTPDYNLSAGYMLMPDGARYRNT